MGRFGISTEIGFISNGKENAEYIDNKMTIVKKYINTIIEKHNLTNIITDIEYDVHCGSDAWVGDAYIGGGLQAIDADDPNILYVEFTTDWENAKTLYNYFNLKKIRENFNYNFSNKNLFNK